MINRIVITIPMRKISKDELVQLHEDIINETGGEHGVLFIGTIEHIEQFLTVEGSTDFDIIKIASKVLIKIIQGHPFVDGNKRTGFEATDIFLRENGYKIICTPDEGVDFALSIAKNELSEENVYEWMQIHTKTIK